MRISYRRWYSMSRITYTVSEKMAAKTTMCSMLPNLAASHAYAG